MELWMWIKLNPFQVPFWIISFVTQVMETNKDITHESFLFSFPPLYKAYIWIPAEFLEIRKEKSFVDALQKKKSENDVLFFASLCKYF